MNELSIIIPVFNSEKYLVSCLNSILERNKGFYEVIIIDDGSSDSSYEILKNYESIYNTVKILKKNNGGVSSARNLGIEVASGEFLAFVDSDDMLYPNSLSKRIDEARMCDLLVSSYIEIDDVESKSISYMPLENDYSIWEKHEMMKELYLGHQIGYQGFLWNKIFRTDIIKRNNIKFDESLFYNEDRLFVLQYLVYCHTIHYSNTIVYQYRKNLNGAMAKMNKIDDVLFDKLKTEFDAFEKMENILIEEEPTAFKYCYLQKFYRYIYFYQYSVRNAKKIRKYTRLHALKSLPCILKMPNSIVPFIKKIKAVGHVIFMR